MAGYGRSQAVVDTMNITVELKSVNHRYFEFNSRVPRNYGFLDEKLKSYMGSRIARGKVECYVSVENLEDDEIEILVNHSLAKSYLGALRELADRNELNLRDDLAMSSLARNNDIFTVHKQEADEEKIWNAVKSVAEKAVEKFIEMRETEGNKLKNDVLSRADLILQKVSVIEERSPQTIKEYNDKLLARINEFLSDVQVDEQRLLTECAIFADKVAVALAEAQSYADGVAGAANDAADAAKDAADAAQADIDAHIADENNPHKVTKALVGLGNVDNKSVAEIKTEFTGEVAQDNAGFVTGGAVYSAVEGAKSAANTYTDGKVQTVADELDVAEADISTIKKDYVRVKGDQLVFGQNDQEMVIIFDCGGAN